MSAIESKEGSKYGERKGRCSDVVGMAELSRKAIEYKADERILEPLDTGWVVRMTT